MGVLGTLGFTALIARNNLLLCAYVVSCVMTGAALAVYALLVDYLLASSCLVVQSAYDGCGSCPCAQTNTCSAADLAATPACADCQAGPGPLTLVPLRVVAARTHNGGAEVGD